MRRKPTTCRLHRRLGGDRRRKRRSLCRSAPAGEGWAGDRILFSHRADAYQCGGQSRAYRGGPRMEIRQWPTGSASNALALAADRHGYAAPIGRTTPCAIAADSTAGDQHEPSWTDSPIDCEKLVNPLGAPAHPMRQPRIVRQRPGCVAGRRAAGCAADGWTLVTAASGVQRPARGAMACGCLLGLLLVSGLIASPLRPGAGRRPGERHVRPAGRSAAGACNGCGVRRVDAAGSRRRIWTCRLRDPQRKMQSLRSSSQRLHCRVCADSSG